MKAAQITKALSLEENRHFVLDDLKVPLIDSHLYTPLGKQLFDFYQKYKISTEDQRQIESLCFLLSAFTIERKPKSFWKRLLLSVGIKWK